MTSCINHVLDEYFFMGMGVKPQFRICRNCAKREELK